MELEIIPEIEIQPNFGGLFFPHNFTFQLSFPSTHLSISQWLHPITFSCPSLILEVHPQLCLPKAVTGLGHELPMPLSLVATNATCRLHRLPATAVSRRRWRACPRPHRRHRPVGLSCAQLTPGRGTTTTPPAGFPTWCSWCNATKDLRLHQPAEGACPPAPLSSKFLPALHSC